MAPILPTTVYDLKISKKRKVFKYICHKLYTCFYSIEFLKAFLLACFIVSSGYGIEYLILPKESFTFNPIYSTITFITTSIIFYVIYLVLLFILDQFPNLKLKILTFFLNISKYITKILAWRKRKN
jgi:hypothetical protein